MASRFQQATRERLKLRMAIDGPSGSGKSVTALRFAHALALRTSGPGGKGRIAAINTEAGGLRLYHGERFEDDGPFDFCDTALASYAPTQYTSAINDAGREGFDAIIIDSLSHAWEGRDGALDQVGKSTSKNSYTAWKDVTPQHRAMVEAILQSPCHVIVTMRSKTEYVLEEVEGKKVPRKIGVAPVQRAGMEYEFDLYCSMDLSHVMTVTKSRCRHVDGAIAVKPGGDFMRPVIEWLAGGTAGVAAAPARVVELASADQVAEIVALSHALGRPATGEQFQRDLVRKFNVGLPADLRPDQADSALRALRAEAQRKNKAPVEAVIPAAQPAPSPAPVAAAPAPITQSTPAPTPALNVISAKQLHELAALKAQLMPLALPDKTEEEHQSAWLGILAARGVVTARDLTPEQADQLIAKLAHKVNVLALEAAPPYRHIPDAVERKEAAAKPPDIPF